MTRAKGKKLTPGSHARIFRDGAILEGPILTVPDGRFTVRHLNAGSYVARDETGGSVEFVVGVDGEEAVIVAGSDVKMGSAEPGSAWTHPEGADVAEGDEQKFPPAQKSADTAKHPPQADIPVLGEPGSAKITLETEPNTPVLGGEDPADGQPEKREVLGTSPFPGAPADPVKAAKEHPAVSVAGSTANRDSGKKSAAGAEVLVGLPPKSIEPEDAPKENPGAAEPDPDKPSPAPDATEETRIEAAAGPFAPMPDVSGDEPEQLPPADAPAGPVGKIRTESNTARKKSSSRKSSSKSSSRKK